MYPHSQAHGIQRGSMGRKGNESIAHHFYMAATALWDGVTKLDADTFAATQHNGEPSNDDDAPPADYVSKSLPLFLATKGHKASEAAAVQKGIGKLRALLETNPPEQAPQVIEEDHN